MYLSNKGDGRQIVTADEKVTELTLRIEQLERENATFRAAQKACEDCDAPTIAEVGKLRELLRRARGPLETGRFHDASAASDLLTDMDAAGV